MHSAEPVCWHVKSAHSNSPMSRGVRVVPLSIARIDVPIQVVQEPCFFFVVLLLFRAIVFCLMALLACPCVGCVFFSHFHHQLIKFFFKSLQVVIDGGVFLIRLQI